MRVDELRDCLHYALAPETRKPALKIAVVVGSLLVLINQWGAVTGQAPLEWPKLVLTYLVPYGVSTYTSVSRDLAARRKHEAEEKGAHS